MLNIAQILKSKNIISSNKCHINIEEKGVHLVHVYIPVPAQVALDLTDALVPKQSFLSMVKLICVKYSASKCKTFNALDYLLRYNEELKFECRAERIRRRGEQLTESVTFRLPIYLEPYETPVTIELSLNNISSLYYKSPNVQLKNIDLASITYSCSKYASGIECTTGIELEKYNVVKFETSDSAESSLPLYARDLCFIFEDELFKNEQLFYGRSVRESMKNFLNSCIKFRPTSASCFSLATCKFWGGESSWQDCRVEKVRRDKIKIFYSNGLQTCLYGKDFNTSRAYFDLNTDKLLKPYFFEKICIQSGKYDEDEDVVDVGKMEEFGNACAYKLVRGLFVCGDEVCYGVDDFRLSKRVPNKMFKSDEQVLGEKHFAFLFSLPVASKETSYFAVFNFFKFSQDFNFYMDLDSKYAWQLDSFAITRKEFPNDPKIVDGKLLNRKIIQSYRFAQENYDLSDLNITVRVQDFEYFLFKINLNQKIVLNLCYSKEC